MSCARNGIVRLENKAWIEIQRLCDVARREDRETSWRLLGRHEGNDYVIDEVIGPGVEIDAGPCHIRADAQWQQAELERKLLVCSTLRFVGEGHLHPPGLARLSRTDIRQGASMASDPDYGLRGSVLLMLVVPNSSGTLVPYAWRLIATAGQSTLLELDIVVSGAGISCGEEGRPQAVSPKLIQTDIGSAVNALARALAMTIRSASVTVDETVVLRFAFDDAAAGQQFDLCFPAEFPRLPPSIVNWRGSACRSLVDWTEEQSLAAYVFSALPLTIFKRAKRCRTLAGAESRPTTNRLKVRRFMDFKVMK